ncbi:uncharacterized protein [Typha latifolia]|uniref:uncharacterized protein n=1 Tax=Typha latifolia TaxID=4733 RepID=UPI003C30558D
MEGHTSSAATSMASERSEVDTTRPFRSVKEAVAVFGERLSLGGGATPKPLQTDPLPPPKPVYSSAPSSSPSYSSSLSHINQDREEELIILDYLKKLEAELHETKHDLVLLKNRESEMELAVASLNAQLHKNLSKLEEIEAASAAEIVEEKTDKVRSDRWAEERIRDLPSSYDYLPTLAEALSLGELEEDDYYGGGGRRKRKVQKKKPIIPLIGDMFSRKKSSNDQYNSLYLQSFHSVI